MDVEGTLSELEMRAMIAVEIDDKQKAPRPAHHAPHAAPDGTKWCGYGEHFLPIESFSSNRAASTGLQAWCRACTALAARRAYARRKTKPKISVPDDAFRLIAVTPAALRAEGVFEVGRVGSILYVQTEERLWLFHAQQQFTRALDDYAVALAVNWLESGEPSYSVAAWLGVDEPHLRASLKSAGYARRSLQDGGSRAGADARNRGNRHGRLIKSSERS